MESVAGLLPFLLILVAFYFLIIRPARNRQRAQQQLTNTLNVGQEVLTTSGLYATIASIDDDAVLLEVSPGVTLRYAKAAVARIVTPQDVADDDSLGTDDQDENETSDAQNASGHVADSDTSEKRAE